MSRLNPIISSFLQAVLQDTNFLFSLLNQHQSPLYLLFPNEFLSNVRAFKQVYVEQKIEGEIFYAFKVNKTEAFLEICAYEKIGVEVSSINELQVVLGHGISGKQILISGPVKSNHLLFLAMQHHCTIVVDELSEIRRVVQLRKILNIVHKVNIQVRISGFKLTTTGRSEPGPAVIENSLFGLPLSDIEDLYSLLNEVEIQNSINLNGLMFHIDNHSISDRGEAIFCLIHHILKLRKKGFDCKTIDIGGGFSVKYIDYEDWEKFIEEYVYSLKNNEPFMFRDKVFGLKIKNGKHLNRGNFYPYDLKIHKEQVLNSILLYRPKESTLNISETLKKYNIKLNVEPGKSLVDQAGITICRITGKKKSSKGDPLLICDMNISQLYEQFIGSEFLVDPVLIQKSKSKKSTQGWHIAGNLCSESDVLSWRKIYWDATPDIDDLLVFANTGGYQMDFAESRMHSMRLPSRIIIYKKKKEILWKHDTIFSLFDFIDC